MLRIRIVSASVVTALALALTAGAATAQTVTNSSVGKPLSLLAGLLPSHAIKQQHESKAHHARVAVHHSKVAHRKFAAKTTTAAAAAPTPADVAPPSRVAEAPTPAQVVNLDNIWPTQAQGITANTTANTPPAGVTPAPDTTPVTAADALGENAIMVNGQTVQIAAPDEVNAIDLAADKTKAASSADQANAAPAAQTVLTARAHADAEPNDSPVGSASWIAQVLAALGGALAAGSVAWFLIGSGPQRMYG